MWDRKPYVMRRMDTKSERRRKEKKKRKRLKRGCRSGPLPCEENTPRVTCAGLNRGQKKGEKEKQAANCRVGYTYTRRKSREME